MPRMKLSIDAKAVVTQNTRMQLPSHTQKLEKMNFSISSTMPYRTRFQVARNPSVSV
jgi:hypothetical protein